MISFVLALLATAAQTPAPAACAYDPHVLDLGFGAFDQDAKGGWRALSKQPGCENRAADMVRDYREQYQAVMPLLYWHEAQLRAFAGQTAQAIALMMASRQPADKDVFGWNPYVEATIAFLRNDRNGFLRARARLNALEKPKDWTSGEWPQNGRVVEGLWHCFGQPYKAAYGTACRPTTARS